MAAKKRCQQQLKAGTCPGTSWHVARTEFDGDISCEGKAGTV